MICGIIKWMISSSLDSGKEFPSIVTRHLASCSSCRDFAAISDEIGFALSSDADRVIAPNITFALPEKQTSAPLLRPAFACAAAICVFVAVAMMVTFTDRQTPGIGEVASVAAEIVEEFHPSPMIIAQIDQFEGEIDAIERDIEGIKELLVASAPFVSDNIIENFLF